MVNRNTAAAQAEEVLQIIAKGAYAAPSGRRVFVRDEIRRSVEGTVSYPPEHPLPASVLGDHATVFEVRHESTIAAVLRLADEGHAPAALNFASARNPGGGFLGGARAQEESLARSSGLYACLLDQPMYDFHRNHRDTLYTSWAIYSPGVPVFRGDDGELLEAPRPCAFVTAAAPNAGVVLEREPGRRREVRAALAERIERVLAIFAAHGHGSLVLGAWGCGVFRNDPREVAELFHAALTDPFRGAFERVVFAVLDSSKNGSAIRPFREWFGGAGGSSE